ncbi:N-acetylmuramoyl-L-alanine amidase [Terribacillus sp. 7520-G]|uniref:N-acetylmuramoyl-L-alanine amidase n=1 Tax=Terribacillus TaxID=459532 RepID=UPI001E5DF724|nr:N-acetylmuramoyl-L-alanine amidase [Terribacillus sp. 7520-G]
MVKIYIDPGHGGKDPGAQGNGLKEKDVVLEIAKKVRDRLVASGFEVKMSRTGDTYPTLTQRTNEANAWGADFFLSIHINAGGGHGYEDYRYITLSASSSTGKMHATIHKHMKAKVGKYGMPDRGMKQKNLHVLRESKMAAVLTELGFIDNSKDAADLKNSSFKSDAAWGLVDALCEIYGKKPTAPGGGSGSGGAVGKMVIVKDNPDGWLWVYNKPDWNAKYQKVKPGEAFTIAQELTVSGSKMYKLKSGLYITAASKYVEVK